METMFTNFGILFLWILTIFFNVNSLSATDICPEQCQCVRTKLYCVKQNLTTLPAGIPETVTHIYLRENSITDLNKGAFSHLPNLQSIEMSYCKIKRIEPGAFNGLEKLKNLNLANNEIEEIATGTFGELKNLQKLDLGNNNLIRLHSRSFVNLTLSSLSLSFNRRLNDLSDDAFEGLSVIALSLDHVNFTSSELESLSPLKESLKELVLANNQQPLSIQSDILKGFQLSKLWITYSGVSDISFLQHVEADDVSLTGNTIGPINFSMFPKMEKTRILRLQATDFIPFDGSYFITLKSLEQLYLQNNNIQTIPESTRPLFERLSRLNLQGNKLHCNCEIKWFKSWLDNAPKTDVSGAHCTSPKEGRIRSMDKSDFECMRPKITDKSKDRVIHRGDVVNLTVTAVGDPAPMIIWNKDNGEKIVTSPTHNKMVTQTTSVITIKKFDGKHSGIYTVTASNVVANVSTVIAVSQQMEVTNVRTVVDNSSTRFTMCIGQVIILSLSQIYIPFF